MDSQRLSLNFLPTPILFVFLFTFATFVFGTTVINDQSCPLRVGPYELQNTTPDGNRFRCKNDVNTAGNTNCSLSCTYKRPDRREVNSFSIHFEYTSMVASSISTGSPNMCVPNFVGGVNRQDLQVLALPESVNNADEKTASDAIIRDTFARLEPVAVRCPATVRPVEPTLQPEPICPDRLGAYYRFNPLANLGYPMDNDPDCEANNDGNMVCRLACSYRNSDLAGASGFLLTPIWTTKYGRGRAGDNAMCVLAPGSPWLAHASKQAVVRFEGVEGADELDAATQASSGMIERLENRAVACPARPTETRNCNSLADRLFELRAKGRMIQNEIDELNKAEERLPDARRSYARSVEILKALADPSYSGPERESAQRLNDPDVRRRLSAAFGISSNSGAIVIASEIAKFEKYRIEYFENARSLISKLIEEKVEVDLESKARRMQMAGQRCFEEGEAQSCDLDGRWLIGDVATGSSLNEAKINLWTFTPSADNVFVIDNRSIGFHGTAEIFGRRAFLKFGSPDLSGTYEIEFDQTCKTGRGTLTLTGNKPERRVVMFRPR